MESSVTWCNNQHLKLTMNKTKEPVVDFTALIMGVVVEKLYIHTQIKDLHNQYGQNPSDTVTTKLSLSGSIWIYEAMPAQLFVRVK